LSGGLKIGIRSKNVFAKWKKAQAQLIEASKGRLNGGIHLIEASKGRLNGGIHLIEASKRRLDEKCI